MYYKFYFDNESVIFFKRGEIAINLHCLCRNVLSKEKFEGKKNIKDIVDVYNSSGKKKIIHYEVTTKYDYETFWRQREAKVQMFCFAKKNIEEGKSEIVENWKEHTNLKNKEILDALKWLYDDPTILINHGQVRATSRAIAIEENEIVKLRRVYYSDGSFCGFYYDSDTFRYKSNFVGISSCARI